MNMFLYRVSWGYYEEYDPEEFTSDKCYDADQFQGLIKDYIEQASTELLYEQKGKKYPNTNYIGVQDIIERVREIMLKNSFKKAVYNGSYYIWGSGIINSEEDVGKAEEHFISKDTLKKIFNHNKTVEAEGFAEVRKKKEKV